MEIADVSSVQGVKHMTVQGSQVLSVIWVGNKVSIPDVWQGSGSMISMWPSIIMHLRLAVQACDIRFFFNPLAPELSPVRPAEA